MRACSINVTESSVSCLVLSNYVKETSQFNESFIKSYNEESGEGYFLGVDVKYLEKLDGLHNNWNFCLKEWKFKKLKIL